VDPVDGHSQVLPVAGCVALTCGQLQTSAAGTLKMVSYRK
jgi:hypothetical protein